jgi:hypothetical protein
MNGQPFDRCAFAVERYKSIAKWRTLWTILLFIFGSTVIIFLCGAVLLFIRESWLPAALSTFGTVAQSFGVRWVLARRSDAVAEEAEAYEDVQSECGGGALGGGATPQTARDRGALQDVQEYGRRLRLFGRF